MVWTVEPHHSSDLGCRKKREKLKREAGREAGHAKASAPATAATKTAEAGTVGFRVERAPRMRCKHEAPNESRVDVESGECSKKCLI